MLLSRKKEAESMETSDSIMGLDWYDNEVLIGGSDDQTLPFIITIPKIKN